MKKTTKGALAAGSAAVLMLGGAGTLAYWTATDDAEAGSVTNGYLTLTDGACDADWVHENANAAALPANAVGDVVTTIVPGDVISKSCTFTVGAQGDNLSATPTLPTTVTIDENPTGTTFDATVAATYDLDGDPVTIVTSDDDGEVLTARIVVTIPDGDTTTQNANDTQRLVATLDTLTVSLTQDLV